MPQTGDEIRARLEKFVARWHDYTGTERSEAQPFLDGLLGCYGTDRKAVGARFEQRSGTGFIDLIWPTVCIVEMKRPSEAGNLAVHRDQAFEYWKRVSRETGEAGRFVVVCAFHRFEVFEPGAYWDRVVAAFDLAELPERYEALDFLRGEEPRFAEDRAVLTREAVALVTDLYGRLGDRGEGGSDVRRSFILQTIWCMFAEDLGLIPEHRFTRTVERLLSDPSRSSVDDLGNGIFHWLATPGERPTHGIAAGVPYADGGLFIEPALVHLEHDELELLRQACSFDWKHVEPAIFGSLLEGALGRERVWAFGAHYTSEEDIRKVVEPTVVEPWRERVEACSTLDEVRDARESLSRYVVLDPACGSGNFLYVAYRELRRIDAALRSLERRLRAEQGLPTRHDGPGFPVTNVYGIELEPFAVELARVTIWIGHALAVLELELEDPILPLPDLSHIRRADALKVEWPHADAIIGNPPYHGSQRIRRELGDYYAEWLKREFGVGLKDYAVYWFRKAHEALPREGRAGLVATNSISQNRSRGPSLDWIVDTGGMITSAVSSQPWSGEAKVHVSIVNWVKQPIAMPAAFLLDGREVSGITSALRPGADRPKPHKLQQNLGVGFQGVIPAGNGFIISESEAEELLQDHSADYGIIVRRYLMGDDISNDPMQAPTRWIIDFGTRSLEEANNWPRALDIVRHRVRPTRLKNRDSGFRERWWRFGRPRGEMREAVEG